MNSIQSEIIYLESVSSTNEYLEDLIEKGQAKNAMVICADYQTSGKGMMQNQWQSEKGKNLLFSIAYLNLDLKAKYQFYLSKVTSIVIHDMLTDYVGLDKVQIKWPNDILVQGRKISGTLIKCSLRNENVQHAIVGVGINVNQNSFDHGLNATSIANEINKYFDVQELMLNTTNRLNNAISLIQDRKWEIIDQDYHERLLGHNKWMKFKTSEEEFDARILNVGDDGRINLELKTGLRNYEIKEIDLVSTQPVYPPAY